MRELERDRSDTNPSLPALAVVGPGRVGRAVARAAADAGLEVSLAGRRDALAACERAGAGLLCVPDGAIEAACQTVARAVPPLRFLGHTSGATPLSALSSASDRGVQTFSLHPLQTIPDGGATLTGAPCAVSGDSEDALALARALALALGMRPFEVREEGRAAYHAAACMASNFLVALEESAAGLMAAAGVEDPRELLSPLVLQTAANWSERGGSALTGPIARGDRATVDRHQEALAVLAPELAELYRALAARTADLAARNRGGGATGREVALSGEELAP